MENKCTSGKPENSTFALENGNFMPSELVDSKKETANTNSTNIKISRVVSTACHMEIPWLKYVPRDKDVISINESTKD